MPKEQHKICLQLLANACRCIIKQDEYGRIVIRANFANIIDSDNVDVSTNGHTKWSTPSNIIKGSKLVYADLTRDFLKADGKMYFLPEDENYLDAGYVSEQVADVDGMFSVNPTITIQLPAAYTYQGLSIDFGGNSPFEIIIHVYRYGEFVESVSFNNIKNENFFIHEFKNFDKLILEFTKGYPENHVVVNTVAFGDLTDYRLTELDYMKFPTGYRENKTKKVRVRLFSFTDGEDGEPVMVDNEEYVEKSLGSVGLTKTLQNPLIHTEEHAQALAEWVGNYYANNVYYTVKYRGEPRINAADIIHAYSDVKKDMQVEVTQNDISFNGKFSGTMEYRRALKMM